MSVFFENEFKNESENEIKNESENRCIMLPEEVKGKGYFALTGSKLEGVCERSGWTGLRRNGILWRKFLVNCEKIQKDRCIEGRV